MLNLETKEIKTLIENDDKLQWWAAILFAELYGTAKECDYISNYNFSKQYWVLFTKLKEFEQKIKLYEDSLLIINKNKFVLLTIRKIIKGG